MVQWASSPGAKEVGIGTMVEKPGDAVIVLPVEFANQHHYDALRREFAALDQNLHGAIVESLGGVVRNFVIVWVGAALHQQTCELRVVGHSSSTVQDAFQRRFGPVLLVVKPGVRAGS